MVIRGWDTLFVPILIPYILGDFLKIKRVKNALKIIRAWCFEGLKSFLRGDSRDRLILYVHFYPLFIRRFAKNKINIEKH